MSVRHLLCAALLVLVVALVGCPRPQETASQTAPTSLPPSPATGASSTPAAGGEEMASCPVLGTTMPKSKMIPVEHEGKTYYLCCQDCVPKFRANPKKYTEHPAKPLPPSSGM